MTARTKRIDDMRKLEKKINMWAAIGELARRIARFAEGKRCGYLYEQDLLIDELTCETQVLAIEARKERNRRNLNFDYDL